MDKLDWLNGRWVREDLTVDQFAQRVAQWALNADYMKPIIPLVQQRTTKFSDLGPTTAMFFSGLLGPTPELFKDVKKLTTEDIRKALFWAMHRLDRLRAWNADAISEVLRDTGELMGFKARDFLKPFFLAIAGREVAPPLFQSMEILGRDVSRARMRQALEVLGGPSKKESEAWTKELEGLLRARGEGQDEEE